MLATMFDVYDSDHKEYIKIQEVNLYFFGSCDASFIAIFLGQSNENGLRYLCDMLATMVDVDDGDHKCISRSKKLNF